MLRRPHTGLESFPPDVTLRSRPARSTVQIAPSRENAISLPFGDQAGSMVSIVDRVSRCSPRPSAAIE